MIGNGHDAEAKRREDAVIARRVRACAQLSRASAFVAAALSVVALVGWAVGSPLLTGLSPRFVPLAPNTAVALLLLSGSLFALVRPDASGSRRRIGALIAAAAGLIGAATVLEFLAGVDLHIDRLLVPAGGCEGVELCGRPSLNGGLALVVASAALLTLDVRLRGRHPAQVLAAIVGGSSLAALAGYVYGAPPLYRIPQSGPATGLSVHAAVALSLLAVGIFSARPHVGAMAVVLSSHAGGAVARRFLVAALAAPLLGVVFMLGVSAGIYSVGMSAALIAVAAMVIAIVGVLRTARELDEADRTLRATEVRHRAFVEHASDPIFLADMTGRFVDVNRAGREMLGYSLDELLATAISDVVVEGELPALADAREHLLSGGTHRGEWHLCRKDGRTVVAELTATITPEGQWQVITRDVRVDERGPTGRRGPRRDRRSGAAGSARPG